MPGVLRKIYNYEIREGKDGKIYCTCPGWRYRRWCKHLAEFFNEIERKEEQYEREANAR